MFSPNQDPTSQYSAVIPKFIMLLKNGKRSVIYGDRTQSRDFTYFDNNVEANIQSCFTENISGETFNIACSQRLTLLDLVKNINELLDTSIEPVFEKERLGDVKHSFADIDKAKYRLGFKVSVHFKTGLKRLVEFL